MKENKILLQATVRIAPGISVSPEKLKAVLGSLGHVELGSFSQIDVAPSKDLSERVWVHISNQEDEPYFRVSGAFEHSEEDITEHEIQYLRTRGVCVEVCGEYPRSDRYGAPPAATNDEAAEAIAAEHLFAVASEGIKVDMRDRGDDGGEAYWLCIAMPKGAQ